MDPNNQRDVERAGTLLGIAIVVFLVVAAMVKVALWLF